VHYNIKEFVLKVPLDCSNEVVFSENTVVELKALSSKFSDLFADLLAHLLVTCSCPALHDPVAAFYVTNPECFMTKLIRVDVECNKVALNYAQTICDFKGKTDRQKNVSVCYKTNKDEFWKAMIECIKLANDSSPLKI
jgi:inosine-uridine nucleoside N-ribohydrolase